MMIEQSVRQPRVDRAYSSWAVTEQEARECSDRMARVAVLRFDIGVIGNLEKPNMQKPSFILVAATLSALSLSSLTITSFAVDDGEAVKTNRPPYKPGREISDGTAAASRSTPDNGQPVESGQPPYKPGRELQEEAAPQAGAAADDGGEPVTHGRAPYKPGREAEEH